MTDILVSHHAPGPTPRGLAFADDPCRAGHTVHMPDFHGGGRTFNSVEEGVGHAEDIGFGEIMGRGVRAAEEVPAALVYAGFSLGVMPAQRLAQTRAGTRGAVLLHACLSVSEFDACWPEGVPVQIHGKEADPYFANEAARELVAGVADAELFLYHAEQHLFAGSSSASFDAGDAALLTERVLASLARANEATAP